VREEERSVGRKKSNRAQTEETKQSRWGFRGKTVWNWLELFIVPIVLVGIGLLFEMQQADRQEATEEQQQALAEQRAQDEALQAYLNQMSSLLLEKHLRTSKEDSEVRSLARVRTLTVLRRLDPGRKADVMYFLMEAELIQSVEGRGPIIRLGGADLSGTDLSAVQFSVVDKHFYKITGASLVGADLRSADLSGANLYRADLRNAILIYADLSGANLSDSLVTNQQLEEPKSLEGATMPNGQKYEDWLNDNEGREEDEENSTLS
jgi:hypothetical protein